MCANTIEQMPPPTSLLSESVTSQYQHSRRKRKKTSITHAYLMMRSVHGKLSEEASKAECDFRILVGHANLLDSLLMTLNDNIMENETLLDQTTETYSYDSDYEDSSHCDSESSSDNDSDNDSEISWSSSESDSSNDSELNCATMEHGYYLPGISTSRKAPLLKLNWEASKNDG